MTTEEAQSPAVPVEVQAAEGFDPAQSAGLFVGVSNFEDERFVEVPFAVDDAVDLAYLFTFELRLMTPLKVVLGLAGVPRKTESQQRLRALRDAGSRITSARQTEIYAQLDGQRQAAGTNGLFVATLATHGFSDQGGDFLVAADSLRRRIERTGVAVAELFDDVARSPSPRRLVLVDACRERLSEGTRAGAEPQAAMSRSFAAAIAGASGQAVLAGATLGGYAYDDTARGNGVFTGAILDGLSGRAEVDEGGFITVRTLADFADRQVVEWVRDHRPDHASVSQGIARRIEGEASLLPLAVDPARRQAETAWNARREAALAHLRENFGETITGGFYDRVAAALGGGDPRPETEPLLTEIEALDGEGRSQRSLAYYFEHHFGRPYEPSSGGPVPGVALLASRVGPMKTTTVAPDGRDVRGRQRGEAARSRWRWILAVGALATLAIVSWVGLRPLWTGEAPAVGGKDEAQLASPPPQQSEPPPSGSEDPGGEALDAEDGSGVQTLGVQSPPPEARPESSAGESMPVPSAESAVADKPPPSRPKASAGESTDGKTSSRRAGSQTDGPIGMRFRYAPAGTFRMGSPETEAMRGDETPHQVKLTRALWIGETEVTQEEWQQLMDNNPSQFKQCGEDCPVENVNWFEAVALANRLSEMAELEACYQLSGCNDKKPGHNYMCSEVKLESLDCRGYRLPTEAEWEYAARAGTETPFSTGSNITTWQANHKGNFWYTGVPQGKARKTTVPVRSFDANPWGLYQLHGNVFEWVWDWFGSYPRELVIDPTGPGPGRSSARVVRGGSWNFAALACRSASRQRYAPDDHNSFVGFRLVRTAD